MELRRKLIFSIGAGVVSSPLGALAQVAGRHYRIGWLASYAESHKEPQAIEFVKHLAALGFVEGRNLTIERRHSSGRLDQLPLVAAELGRLNCDAFFGSGNEATLAALTQINRTTPIVFAAVDFDPVLTGDVASLARPGGRVTGVTTASSELPAKRLELLKELLPSISRVAVFANAQTGVQLSLVQGTSRRLDMSLHVVDFKRPPFDYAAGFAEVTRSKSEAIFVLGSSLWLPAMSLITTQAAKLQLPTVFHHSGWVEAGGLMSYGFNFPGIWRQAGDILVKILKGAKPGETPMELPNKFEMVFNLKTAKSLGIAIPKSLMVRADRVIE